MYAKYSQVVHYAGNSPRNANEFKLKQHHHVRIDKEFKLDCELWLRFLTEESIHNAVCWPMVDLLNGSTLGTEVGFFSAASKKIGFGAIVHKWWIRGDWPVNFMEQEDPSIEFLELFTLCAGVLTWQNQPVLMNAQIVIHCDNIAVVHMINNLTSSFGHCMYLLRLLILDGLWFNRKLRAVYINMK